MHCAIAAMRPSQSQTRCRVVDFESRNTTLSLSRCWAWDLIGCPARRRRAESSRNPVAWTCATVGMRRQPPSTQYLVRPCCQFSRLCWARAVGGRGEAGTFTGASLEIGRTAPRHLATISSYKQWLTFFSGFARHRPSRKQTDWPCLTKSPFLASRVRKHEII